MISAADIRKSMRISHKSLDDEIKRNIDTCLLDLEWVGIDVEQQSELLNKACELYCKAEYNFMGKGEEFRKNYENLRDSMSLSDKYHVQ